jgi:ABC-type transporter Mla MlaB component
MRKITITLSKSILLKNIKEIHNKLKEAVHKSTHIKLILKDIEQIDLSGIQLLYSFHTMAEENKIKLEIQAMFSPEAIMLLNNCGYKYVLEKLKIL